MFSFAKFVLNRLYGKIRSNYIKDIKIDLVFNNDKFAYVDTDSGYISESREA